MYMCILLTCKVHCKKKEYKIEDNRIIVMKKVNDDKAHKDCGVEPTVHQSWNWKITMSSLRSCSGPSSVSETCISNDVNTKIFKLRTLS